MISPQVGNEKMSSTVLRSVSFGIGEFQAARGFIFRTTPKEAGMNNNDRAPPKRQLTKPELEILKAAADIAQKHKDAKVK
jgi:hypothetical protein